MLSLIPCTSDHLDTLLNAPGSFPAKFGLKVVEGYLEFPEALHYSLARLQSGEVQPEWWTHLVVHEPDQALIGMGGFFGPPDEQGRVMIGYGIAPSYRGQGLAKQAAALLTAKAFADRRVQIVCAETLAEINASTNVLEANGFRKISNRVDSEDGPVWGWEFSRPEWDRRENPG